MFVEFMRSALKKHLLCLDDQVMYAGNTRKGLFGLGHLCEKDP